MTSNIDHDRCSELLRGHVRGVLSAADTAAVEAHLAGCEACSAELRALALLERDPPQTLTDLERRRLRHAVLDALRQPDVALDATAATGDQVAGAPAAGPWMRRLGAALGAAALIAVAAVGVATLGGSGGEDAASTAGRAEQGAGEDADSGAGSGAADTAVQPPVQPIFVGRAGELSERDLQRLGEQAFAVALFSPEAVQAQSEALRNDAERSEEDTTEDGAAGTTESHPTSSAGTVGWTLPELDQARDALRYSLQQRAGGRSDTVDRCIAAVLADDTLGLAPVYAAFGTFEGDPALILGFMWSDLGDTPNRYFIWVARAGSSCEIPLKTIAGRLGR